MLNAGSDVISVHVTFAQVDMLNKAKGGVSYGMRGLQLIRL